MPFDCLVLNGLILCTISYTLDRPDFPTSPLPATSVWRRGSESIRHHQGLRGDLCFDAVGSQGAATNLHQAALPVRDRRTVTQLVAEGQEGWAIIGRGSRPPAMKRLQLHLWLSEGVALYRIQSIGVYSHLELHQWLVRTTGDAVLRWQVNSSTSGH